MAKYDSILGTVGNTPVVRVVATLPPGDEGATLTLVKVTDPSGSVLLPRPRSGKLPAAQAIWREYQGQVIEHDFAPASRCTR